MEMMGEIQGERKRDTRKGEGKIDIKEGERK